MNKPDLSLLKDELPPLTSDLSAAKRHLVEYGLARIANVLSPKDVVRARTRLLEQAEAERERGVSIHDASGDPNAPDAGPNQRVRNLINKGGIFREIAVNPKTLEMVRFLLGKHALLSSFSANIANKHGVQAKILHTDQFFVGAVPFACASATIWALDDFTEENGATVVIPGSHKLQWAFSNSDGAELPKPIPATAPAGSMVILDGRVLHATGENHTDRPRPGLITYFAKPFLRQEENWALSLNPEVMKNCSKELLKLLGFETWFGLGGVDGSKHGTLFSCRPDEFSDEWRPARLEHQPAA